MPSPFGNILLWTGCTLLAMACADLGTGALASSSEWRVVLGLAVAGATLVVAGALQRRSRPRWRSAHR